MEYTKVIVAPDYYQLDPSDFDLALLEMVYASKFHHLTHSQVLGTIVHQLGVERKSFGDILTSDGKIKYLLNSVLFTISWITSRKFLGYLLS